MTYPSAMRVALVMALLFGLLLSACDDGPASTLEGVIVHIDSTAIDDINSFTLKDGDETFEIYIDDDIDYGFPLGHLQEHVQTSEPMRIETEERGGKLYALSITDA